MPPLLPALLFVLLSGGDAPDPEQDRAAIRAHIDRIFQAFIDGDADTLEATHSADWCGFSAQARSTRLGLEQYMDNARRGLASPYRMTGYEMREFHVTFPQPDLALVPYIADTWIGGPEDIRFGIVLRVLDVYARRDGHWIQIASHTARHPETVDALHQDAWPVDPGTRAQILEARRAVWEAYFAADEEALRRLLPEETVVLGPRGFQGREQVLAASARAAAGGGQLVDLAFPETRIQRFGDVAVLYTTYRTTVLAGEEREVVEGRGVEVFVQRRGVWLNPGWHLEGQPVSPGEPPEGS